MAAKKQVKTEAIVIYDLSADELPKSLAAIGELQRKRDTISAEYDSKIQALQAELADKTEPLDREIKKLSHSIKKFMDDNRNKYLSSDRKTLSIETGDISYRSGKMSVKSKSSEKFISAILEKNGLSKTRDSFVKKMNSVFLRMSLELDKDLILKNPESAKEITGVELNDGIERFYLKPYSTSSEIEVE